MCVCMITRWSREGVCKRKRERENEGERVRKKERKKESVRERENDNYQLKTPTEEPPAKIRWQFFSSFTPPIILILFC